MQITAGNFQVLDSNGKHVGYWLSADVSGTLYDWFARKSEENMSTPLDMQNHTLKYDSADQTWYANSAGWDDTKWGNEFAGWLDTKFGSGNWKKLDKYKVTKLSW